MTTTDDLFEQRLRETLRAIGASAQAPERSIERLYDAATRAGLRAGTPLPEKRGAWRPQPPPPVRTPPARRAPLLAVAAVVAVLVVSVGAVVVHRARGPKPADSSPATATSVAASRWGYLPDAPIRGRSYAVGAWTGTQLLVWGGAADSRQQELLADGAAYDPSTRKWSMLPPAPISARVSAVSVWTGRSLFVWGGYATSDAVAPTSDGAIYTPADHSWVALPPAPIPDYQQVVALRSGDLVTILTVPRGGDGSVVHVQSYRSATNSWSRLPDLNLPAGHGVQQIAAVAVPDRVYLWSMWEHSTTTAPNTISTDSGIDGFTFEMPTRRWVANSLGRPAVAAVSQPLWTGRDILLPAARPWCGVCQGPGPMFGENGPSGQTLDPATSATSVIPHGPVDNLQPTYLWTGAALLAVNSRTWVGGSEGASPLVSPGEAAVWDPHTRAWARLPDSPAGASEAPVTVWTGTSLLMWGQFTRVTDGTANAQQTVGLQLGQ